MDEKILKNIRELTDKRNIDIILIESIKEIRLCKSSLWQYCIAVILGLIIAITVSFFYGTVNVMMEVSGVLFDISIGIIGIILGAYSIFQALMQKELINILINSDNNLLKKSNKTFLNIIILNVVNALISLTVKIILSAIGKEFIVFDSVMLNVIFSTILIFCYMMFNLLLLLELIVFAVNLYRMFCAYNTINAINAVKDKED